MKIQHIIVSDKTVRAVTEKTDVRTKAAGSREITDSVSISAHGKPNGGTPLSFQVRVDFPPRENRMREVSERIANSAYSSVEMLTDISDKFLESYPVQDIVNEAMVGAGDNGSSGMERTVNIDANIENGVYDDPDVKRDIANSLLDTLGLSGLFGGE